jgi:hypothetical protein
MARKEKISISENKKRGGGRKILKFFLALCLLLLIFAGLWALFIGLERAMFSRNPHFILRGVETSSRGYWNGRNRLIESRLNLRLDHDNLFELDLKVLRDKLAAISNIKDASVERVLPDILRIQLEERIPRAVVWSKKEPVVVDDSTVIMPAAYYRKLAGTLPQVSGLDSNLDLIPGNDIPEIQPALDLLMVAVMYFPEFRIHNILVSNPDRLSFVADYKRKTYKVIFPRRTANFNHSFMQLRQAIETNTRNGLSRISYDLSHENRVISR